MHLRAQQLPEREEASISNGTPSAPSPPPHTLHPLNAHADGLNIVRTKYSHPPQTQPKCLGCLALLKPSPYGADFGPPGRVRHVELTGGAHTKTFGPSGWSPVWCLHSWRCAGAQEPDYLSRTARENPSHPHFPPFPLVHDTTTSPSMSPSASTSSSAMVRKKVTYYKMLTLELECREEILAKMHAIEE